eukprot:TRINITY_DN16691_c0_g2_i1.p1 TRINITY_DN16691_c0_g2~~TRINITY_DN16691_c0_g2_i1.p1  ORF type:complete len:431 (-),score=138.82 TRINITY_DN16691_c0_g2_i1:155-1255(-)
MLDERGMNFFTGVPDSLLKDFCAYITDNSTPEKHLITANEGAAVGYAAGYHMATGKVPIVYMQNSGLGNTVNPIMSLADPGVYSIPMLMIIGWRGEPGKRDEPQHRVQGAKTPAMLASMDIPFEVLPDFAEGAEEVLDHALHYIKKRNAPYALLVKKQTFEKYALKNTVVNEFPLSREEFLEQIIPKLDRWDVVVGTTGFTSREIFELREKYNQDHSRDFLTVGSMGHAATIGLGIAAAKPSRNVYVFDGDGAALMHMGGMATIGKLAPKNLKHVIINNIVHDSVGGQPTGCENVDFGKVAEGCGYKTILSATTIEEIQEAVPKFQNAEGPALLEVFVHGGARKDLGRPTTTPIENKDSFMEFLEF